MGMIKIVSLNFCERAVNRICKNGFFFRKPFTRSEKCEDCKLIIQREKSKELRNANRLLKRSINQKNKERRGKERLSRALKKVNNYITISYNFFFVKNEKNYFFFNFLIIDREYERENCEPTVKVKTRIDSLGTMFIFFTVSKVYFEK